MTQRMFPRAHVFLASVAALTAAALALRLWKIDANSFWVDELLTSERAHMTLHELFRHLANRNHPPLYFFLLNLLSPLTGLDDAGLRIPSAIFGALCVPTAAWCVWRMLEGWSEERRRFAALAVAIVMTIGPYQVYYGQEARAYTMAVFLGFLHVAAWHVLLFRRDAPPWGWGALFALTAAVGWHLHFAFAAFFGAGAVLTLANFALPSVGKQFIQGAFRRWAVPTAAAFLLCLPWTLYAPKQMGRMSQWQDGFAQPLERLAHMAQNTFRPLGAMPSPYERAAPFHYAWLALFVAGAGLMLWLALREKTEKPLLPSSARWMPAWMGVLLGGYVAAGLIKSAVQMERHYALFAVPLAVIAGAGLASLPRKAGAALLGAWAAWSLSYLALVYYPLLQKTPWREISASLAGEIGESGEGVHTTGVFVRPMLKHYPPEGVRLLRSSDIGRTERTFWWLHVREPQPPVPYAQPPVWGQFKELKRVPVADFVDLVRYEYTGPELPERHPERKRP